MGVLLRGPVENFNPQIHTEGNSLTSNMRKHFAVKKKSLDLFQKETRFISFMYASNRVNGGAAGGKVKPVANEIHDNAFRIAYDGALMLPAYSYGAAQIGSLFDPGNQAPDMSEVVGVEYTGAYTSANVVTNTVASIAIKHDVENNIFGDKFNPNDSVILDGGLGLLFVLTDFPRRSLDSTHYVLDGKFVGPETLFDEAHLAEGEVMTEAGNYFGEGSLRGYQRYKRNKWRINYTSIHRYTLTMTGSAKAQKVTNLVNSETNEKMWEFEAVLDMDKRTHIGNELALRFSRISMDPTGHAWYENYGTNKLTIGGFNASSGLTSPMLGDGWIPQIQDNFVFDYNPNEGLNYLLIENIMTVLSQRSPAGSSGNTFVGITDKIGAMAWDKGFKKLMGWGNNAVNTASGMITNCISDVKAGTDVTLGFKVTKYVYLTDEIIIIEDELFNSPSQHNTYGGVTGTGNIYILNMSMVDGVSNFDLFARANRSMIRKSEPGMVSIGGDSSDIATSGFDGASIHNLAELMAIVYDMRSSGILKASAKFAGGALADYFENKTEIASGYIW